MRFFSPSFFSDCAHEVEAGQLNILSMIVQRRKLRNIFFFVLSLASDYGSRHTRDFDTYFYNTVLYSVIRGHSNNT